VAGHSQIASKESLPYPTPFFLRLGRKILQYKNRWDHSLPDGYDHWRMTQKSLMAFGKAQRMNYFSHIPKHDFLQLISTIMKTPVKYDSLGHHKQVVRYFLFISAMRPLVLCLASHDQLQQPFPHMGTLAMCDMGINGFPPGA
jgi:hypothetical protein